MPFLLAMRTILGLFRPTHHVCSDSYGGEGKRSAGVSTTGPVFSIVYMAGGHISMAEVAAHATPAIEHLGSC